MDNSEQRNLKKDKRRNQEQGNSGNGNLKQDNSTKEKFKHGQF